MSTSESSPSLRILEIGQTPFVSGHYAGHVDFYSILKKAPPEKALNLRNTIALAARLKKGDYDLVVYHITAKGYAPWHRNQFWPKILVDILAKSLFNFHKISWHYFHWILCSTSVPLIVIDTQDAQRITESEAAWLDRCAFWFMRELPANHMNIFLNMDRRCGDVINIQRQERLRRNFEKLKPFGLGFDPLDKPGVSSGEAVHKIYDVFYAGANHTTTVRQRGIDEIRELKREGFRVFLPENRLSQKDFLTACAQSWLVWSPEGQGWDCHRHYEALMMHSVPVINFPTIDQLQPLRHGEHCIYYPLGEGGLTRTIKEALKSPQALLTIAQQGRSHILQHHDRKQLVRHVLSHYDMALANS